MTITIIPASNPDDPYLSVNAAALIIGITAQGLRARIAEGRTPHLKDAGGYLWARRSVAEAQPGWGVRRC